MFTVKVLATFQVGTERVARLRVNQMEFYKVSYRPEWQSDKTVRAGDKTREN